VQASIVIFTNDSSTLIVQIPIVTTIKLEPSEGDVRVLPDSNDDMCPVVNTNG
jgi:hypothetical protein